MSTLHYRPASRGRTWRGYLNAGCNVILLAGNWRRYKLEMG
jgi:hypothetical protein